MTADHAGTSTRRCPPRADRQLGRVCPSQQRAAPGMRLGGRAGTGTWAHLPLRRLWLAITDCIRLLICDHDSVMFLCTVKLEIVISLIELH